MAQLHVARAKAAAAGDGAIALMLAERLLVPRPGLAANLMQDDYQIGDLSVSVTLFPEAALINMNSASQKTLGDCSNHWLACRRTRPIFWQTM